LAAFPIRVPSLRERKDDIPLLAEYFLENMEEGENSLPLAPAVIQKLISYEYAGNVRELRNIVERANILAGPDGVIGVDHVVFDRLDSESEVVDVTQNATNSERFYLKRRGRISEQELIETLNACDGHRAEAARRLGISERTLYRRLNAINNTQSV
jgi:DNA-binding NtrC family response regulator